MATYIIPAIFKGDTFDDLEFAISIDGTPLDLTLYEIESKFKKSSKTGEESKSVSVDDGITLVDALSGRFKIDSFNQNWSVGTYYYDIQFTKGTEINTYIEGTLVIKQDVTN